MPGYGGDEMEHGHGAQTSRRHAAKRGTERLADGYLSRDGILQTYLEKC